MGIFGGLRGQDGLKTPIVPYWDVLEFWSDAKSKKKILIFYPGQKAKLTHRG